MIDLLRHLPAARRHNAARAARQAAIHGTALQRELEAGYARQRIVREARAEAASRGYSASLKRRAAQAREMFHG
jgi:hypothetical protein